MEKCVVTNEGVEQKRRRGRSTRRWMNCAVEDMGGKGIVRGHE